MALCKCEFCGKPFNSVGTKLCAECMREMDSAYAKVRKYIYQNPGEANFAAITEHTEVSEETLNYLIDQGRIMVNSSGARGARCRACGAEIKEGTFCEQCRKKLISEHLFSGLSQKNEDPERQGWKTKPLHMPDR